MIFCILYFHVPLIFEKKTPVFLNKILIRCILGYFGEQFCEFGETEWAAWNEGYC